MKIETKSLLIVSLVLFSLWFIYLERQIVTVFFMAMGFAYILNPGINFLARRLKLGRGLAVTLVYLLIIGGLIWIGLVVGSRLVKESEQFTRETRYLFTDLQSQLNILPDWLQVIAADALESVRSSVYLAPRRFVPYFPGALSRAVNVFVFFFASFYFLRDGAKFVEGLKNLLPGNTRLEVDILANRINRVLGDYLRAEVLLVVIMSTFTFIGLSILNVKYALILAIFTGFAELIPYIGPVAAAAVAIVVAYFDNIASLGLPPLYEMLVIATMYFFLRQLEDLFVIPHVLGRMTKLHPLAVLFAVLAGGQLFGAVGFVIAVPIAASGKIILEYFLDKSRHK